MERKPTSPAPREMPVPLKEPEIKKDDLPEIIVPPDEEPVTIPPEAPALPNPVEMPPAPKNQNTI